MYLAYQNVHTTAQKRTTISGQQPFQAPCATVDEHYRYTTNDAVKVLGAMVTELDYGIGNVTAALQQATREWLMILTSDNGGPINLGNTNWPLRCASSGPVIYESCTRCVTLASWQGR